MWEHSRTWLCDCNVVGRLQQLPLLPELVHVAELGDAAEPDVVAKTDRLAGTGGRRRVEFALEAWRGKDKKVKIGEGRARMNQERNNRRNWPKYIYIYIYYI